MTIAANTSSNQFSGIEYTKKYAKQMLKNTLFTGVFQEKRLVESLDSYRDVVTICPEEADFIQNLRAVKNKIDHEVLFKTWVGITAPDTIGAPVGYNLWVDLPEEVFGKYWYRVKTVEFLEKEIRLKLEIVRPFQKETTPLRNLSARETTENISAILEEKKLQFRENLIYFFKEVLTLNNIADFIKFIAILFSTIIAALFGIITYLLEWLLKLIRELSGLIKALTPVIMNITNLLGKSIFGLYHLIYALFHEKPKPAPVYNNYINFDPQNPAFADPRGRYNQYFNKQLPYYRSIQNGPSITPLN